MRGKGSILCGIYKVSSPSGKVYIGQSKNILARFEDYKKMSCKAQSRLYNSIKKYGAMNHSFEVVELCKLNSLNERERFWQEEFNVLSKKVGLNCKYVSTVDQKIVLSEETLSKIRISLNMYNENKIKSIYQYDLNGELIRIFKNLKDVHKNSSYNYKYVAQCYRGCVNTAYGFIWRKEISVFEESFLAICRVTKSEKLKGHTFNLGRKLTDDHKNKIGEKSQGRLHTAKTKLKMSNSKNKKITQYTKEGEFLKEWSSAKEAGECLGISSQNICSCKSGRLKFAGGYKWI